MNSLFFCLNASTTKHWAVCRLSLGFKSLVKNWNLRPIGNGHGCGAERVKSFVLVGIDDNHLVQPNEIKFARIDLQHIIDCAFRKQSDHSILDR